ncbi:MAG: hypothetical protein ACFFDT_22395, partial [Candidatus Hodarchaeota archaeon]
MNGSQNNNKQEIKQDTNAKKGLKYWDRKPDTITNTTYPQLEPAKFNGFLKKIGIGLLLSFLPSLVFSLISDEILFKTWGFAILIVSGIYFIVGGCNDLSQTSARKGFKRHMER